MAQTNENIFIASPAKEPALQAAPSINADLDINLKALVKKGPVSQRLAWDEDEKYYQSYPNENSASQDHGSAFVQQTANIRFSDTIPVHEGVFTVAEKSKDWIDGVLLRGKTVDPNREGKYEL